ncbi:MAG TPA: hypothetical protein VIK04_02455, partial [Solirubrobacteraceae bacterium]
MPRSAADFVAKLLNTDHILANPDHLLRSSYETRTGDKAQLTEAPPAVPGVAAPAVSESETEKQPA